MRDRIGLQWCAALAAALCLPAGEGLAQSSRPLVELNGAGVQATAGGEDVLLTNLPPAGGTVEFGSAVAFGDVDGDGFEDAVVGQRTLNRVYVYLGSATPRQSPYFTDPNAASLILEASGQTADGVRQFGFSVAAGDVDGDGTDDLLVGAPMSGPGGMAEAGLAYLVLGKGNLAAGQTIDVDAPPPGVVVVKLTRGGGAAPGDLLGFAAAIGRLPSAGRRYVAVSARGAASGAGHIHAVLDDVLPATSGSLDLTVASSATFTGTDPQDALGESLVTCDIDAGGDEDLVAGAMFGDGPANSGLNRGEVLVFGGENLASGVFSSQVPGSSADWTIHGATDGDDLGFSVGCGDVDEDGNADLVAGALFADGVGESRPTSGEVYVLRGRALPQAPVDLSIASDPNDPAPDGADLALYGATTADQLGFAVGVGDLDGDGAGELIVSARRYDRDQALVNVGAVYILRGGAGALDPSPLPRAIDLHAGTARPVDPGYDPNVAIDLLPDRVDQVVIGASKDDHAGFTLQTGNLDGTGGDELLIAAIGDLAREPGFAGEAYIIGSSDRDGDGASDIRDADNDNDGISDEDEVAGTYTGGVPTDPLDQDTDGDRIQDGTELGFTCQGAGGVVEAACDDPAAPLTSTDPSLLEFFQPDADPLTVTDPLDRDSDDDGLADGDEDFDLDGLRGPGETDASDHDTDGDLVFDGTEVGLDVPIVPDTDLAANHFVPDADKGASMTSPIDADSDGDGIDDGAEDLDGNGAVGGDLDFDNQVGPMEIWTETDAADPDTDRDGLGDGQEAGTTDPLDQDTDDDGLPDGWIDGANGQPMDGMRQGAEGEDLDGDGVIGGGESDPTLADTDGDGLLDGLERGLAGMGVPGRNQTPDTLPGEDGTDPNSSNLKMDADGGASTTLPNSTDSDGDGLPDDLEDRDLDGAVEGDLDFDHVVDPNEIWTETDAADADTDRDGIIEGFEDSNLDGIYDAGIETNPLDQDTDDDGLPDGWIDGANNGLLDGQFQAREGEDADGDGVFGTDDGESSPLELDSDGDGIRDGVEAGVAAGGGSPGRNQTPDSGPGEDGTDTTSPSFRADGDSGATSTKPWDADSDDDGLPDGWIDGANGAPLDGMVQEIEGEDFDMNGVQEEIQGETKASFTDTDGDGLNDGLERGVVFPGVLGPDGLSDPADPNIPVQDGTGGPLTAFDMDSATTTDPLDKDTDDDGLGDGEEDGDGSGAREPGETDPLDLDTDGDGLQDGLESGLDLSQVTINTDLAVFTPDLDPATMTDPLDPDTDAGGTPDGVEDTDANGRVDPGETNPNDPADDGLLEFTDVLDGTPIATLIAGGTVFLRLPDADQDLDTMNPDMVAVDCTATPGGDTETVSLAETGDSTGLFVGSLPTTTSPGSSGDSALTAVAGDRVACGYIDPDDAADVRSAGLAITSSLVSPIPELQVSVEADGTIRWAVMPPGLKGGTIVYNVYRGDPRVIATAGGYTQQSLACGLALPEVADPAPLAPESAVFYLVAGVSAGVEGTLGVDSAGQERPSTGQCGQ